MIEVARMDMGGRGTSADHVFKYSGHSKSRSNRRWSFGAPRRVLALNHNYGLGSVIHLGCTRWISLEATNPIGTNWGREY